MNYKLKKISGDASFREFYRLKKGNKNTIIVYANKEKFRNLITYTIINKVLKEEAIFESLISFKRAGANAIVTYFAEEIAKKLTQNNH